VPVWRKVLARVAGLQQLAGGAVLDDGAAFDRWGFLGTRGSGEEG
jgi:hypothetical protein